MIKKIKNEKFNNSTKNAFSIAEAMIVLLIVSIAMAAMAPMISKRTLRGTGGTCEWIVTDNEEDIARPNSNVRIGGTGNDDPRARLDIISSDIAKQAQQITVPSDQSVDVFRIYKTGSGAGIDGVTDLIARINPNGTYTPVTSTPQGMVAFFDLAACPTNWAPANGSQTVGLTKPDLRNRFVRAWDSAHTVDVDAVRTFGGVQTDALQGHKHDYMVMRAYSDASAAYSSGGNGIGLEIINLSAGLSPASPNTSLFDLKDVYVDDGVAKVANETRPKNVSLLACVRK